MFPLYVPTPNKFELTITVNGFNGVAPVPTLVDSQLPPLLVVATTVNDTPAEPEPLLTLKVWLAGLAPVSAAKLRDVGVTVTFPLLPVLLTVSVTLIVCAAAFVLAAMSRKP